MKLTSAQQNILSMQQSFAKTAIANLGGYCFFTRKHRDELLLKAVVQVALSQSALQMAFFQTNGQIEQQLTNKPCFQYEKRAFATTEEMERYAGETIADQLNPFEDPLMKLIHFHVQEQSGLIMVVHHLIADAWSISLLLSMIENAYCRLEAGKACDVPAGDYAVHVQDEEDYRKSGRYTKDRSFWEERYAQRPQKTPISPSGVNTRDIASQRMTLRLPLQLCESMEEFCQRTGVTLSVLLESSVLVYLAKINRDLEHLTIGIPCLNRSTLMEKQTIGMYINTLPLTVSIHGEESMAAIWDRITRLHMSVFRHQHYPYEDIAGFLRDQHDFSDRLYDVMVSCQNAQSGVDMTTHWLSNGASEIPVQFHFDDRDRSGRLTMNTDYQTALFDEQEIRLLCERILFLLSQMMASPEKTVDELSILPQEERTLLYRFFSGKSCPVPEKSMVAALEKALARHNDLIAIAAYDGELTNQELNNWSNGIAQALSCAGVQKGNIVPIITPRNIALIPCVLGVLKTGAAFLMVDPDLPESRIDQMIEQTESRLVLTAGAEVHCTASVKKLDVATIPPQEQFVIADEDENALCYLVFTSGSTGQPKGVAIRHKNILNTVSWRASSSNRHAKETILCTSVSADTLIEDIFVSLLMGRKIILIHDRYDMHEIVQASLTAESPAIMTTPTYIKLIIDAVPAGKNLHFSETTLVGERLTSEVAQAVLPLTDILYNEYGPSECAVCATREQIQNARDRITIGRPIDNVSVQIVDELLKPCPIGMPGEIVLGGSGVGMGYWKQEQLTQQAFLCNFDDPSVRLYKTGDRARFLPDGRIEYIGRIDEQIKLHGMRVEPQEIEQVLLQHEKIQNAAVIVQNAHTPQVTLTAFVIADQALDVSAVRSFAAQKLPRHMVPSSIVQLSAFPLSANGKTDKKALSKVMISSRDTDYVPPVNDQQKVLCDILTKLFHKEPIGITHQFFADLGGDSLLAIQYATQAYAAGIHFSVQDVYERPTILRLLSQSADSDTKWDMDRGTHYQKIIQSQNAYSVRNTPPQSIFLTGATGYLGAHLVKSFLDAGVPRIICLVRKKAERLEECLSFYFGKVWVEQHRDRISVIVGDLESLSSCQTSMEVEAVVHAAASVRHYGNYADLYKANVLGTKNVLDYARRAHASFFYLSTTSVSGLSLKEHGQALSFNEGCLYIGQRIENVYIRSKLEAEAIALDAACDGQRVQILRMGNLTNRRSDMVFQRNAQSNAFYNRMRALTQMRVFPDSWANYLLELTPVDDAADAVVAVVTNGSRQAVYHLNNPHGISLQQVSNIIGKNRLCSVSDHSFLEIFRQVIQNPQTEWVYQALTHGTDSSNVLDLPDEIALTSTDSKRWLADAGFVWPPITDAYIRNYFLQFES